MTSHPQQARPPLEVIAARQGVAGAARAHRRRASLRPPPAPGAVSSADDSPARRRSREGDAGGDPASSGSLSRRARRAAAASAPRAAPAAAQRRRGEANRAEPDVGGVRPPLGGPRADARCGSTSRGSATPTVTHPLRRATRPVRARARAAGSERDRFHAGAGDGERFILGGLCAGAYWSFHAALRDPRVSSALMVNPRALIWDTGLGPARDLRALLTQPFSLAKIRRVATGPRLQAFVRWMLAAPRRALRRLLLGHGAGRARRAGARCGAGAVPPRRQAGTDAVLRPRAPRTTSWRARAAP